MRQRRLGLVLVATLLCAALAKVLVYSYSEGRLIVRAPRVEPLLYDSKEWSCEFADLSPRADVVVLAESDHDQFEHLQNNRFVYQAPWERPEATARLVETARVRATLQTKGGVDWTGKFISYFHHISIQGLSGCSLREGVLRRGQHILFLHEDPPAGSGRFRLVRDLQAATLFVTEDMEQILVPPGGRTQDKILSMLRDVALTGTVDPKEAARRWARLIDSWRLAAEYEAEWERITRLRTVSTRRLEDFCAAGVSTFWWTAGGCDETLLRESNRLGEVLRSYRRGAYADLQHTFEERYGAELAARILAKIQASR